MLCDHLLESLQMVDGCLELAVPASKYGQAHIKQFEKLVLVDIDCG